MKLVATFGLTELSVQDRLTDVALAAVAVRLLGALGADKVVALAVFDGLESPSVLEAVT